MTVYTTVVVWIAFIPAYVSINSRYYKGVPLSVALLINALITTSCLFVPRLYALRWVEGGRLNLRTLSISLHSLSDKGRRASHPDIDKQRQSLSGDITKAKVSTPDILSTTAYHNQGADIDADISHVCDGNSLTFLQTSQSFGDNAECQA